MRKKNSPRTVSGHSQCVQLPQDLETIFKTGTVQFKLSGKRISMHTCFLVAPQGSSTPKFHRMCWRLYPKPCEQHCQSLSVWCGSPDQLWCFHPVHKQGELATYTFLQLYNVLSGWFICTIGTNHNTCHLPRYSPITFPSLRNCDWN